MHFIKDISSRRCPRIELDLLNMDDVSMSQARVKEPTIHLNTNLHV